MQLVTKEVSTIIVTLLTPGAGFFVLGRVHIIHVVKMHYFFKILFSPPGGRGGDQTIKYMLMKTKEMYPNCIFHEPPWACVVLLRGNTSHILRMHYSSLLPDMEQTN